MVVEQQVVVDLHPVLVVAQTRPLLDHLAAVHNPVVRPPHGTVSCFPAEAHMMFAPVFRGP